MDAAFDIGPLMGMLMDEDRESVEAMLETMGEDEQLYMAGYLNGYADAFRAIAMAEGDMPGLHNAGDSDRIA